MDCNEEKSKVQTPNPKKLQTCQRQRNGRATKALAVNHAVHAGSGLVVGGGILNRLRTTVGCGGARAFLETPPLILTLNASKPAKFAKSLYKPPNTAKKMITLAMKWASRNVLTRRKAGSPKR